MLQLLKLASVQHGLLKLYKYLRTDIGSCALYAHEIVMLSIRLMNVLVQAVGCPSYLSGFLTERFQV